jgi:hypothetical protein
VKGSEVEIQTLGNFCTQGTVRCSTHTSVDPSDGSGDVSAYRTPSANPCTAAAQSRRNSRFLKLLRPRLSRQTISAVDGGVVRLDRVCEFFTELGPVA